MQFEIVEKRIRPWVAKKIVEYLGEEEETLMSFIISKLKERTGAAAILAELANVLESEAEIFVIKLWRMIIFEVLRCKSVQ